MTSFTFIHAADLHLGSPLAGLALKDADIARRFAAAGRRAFEDLVTRAIEMEAAFLLVAGDVYDGDWTDNTIGLFFARQVARLDRAGIPVVLVRGNHDAESVITRSITLPHSVKVYPTQRADTHRLDHLRVALHGRSFPNRAVEENYALAYPAAVPGWFNIGLLHTSCTGHAAHATYAPCSVADLAGRGYDYWALGHVHDYAELSRDPWIVFPGNLQGRSVRECGEKGAVAVEVADGRVRAVRRLIVDHARFALLPVDLADAASEREAIARVEDALRPLSEAAQGRLLAVRVSLTGETPLHDRLAADREGLTAEIQAAAHRVHEDIWLERLRIETVRPRAATSTDPARGFGLDPAELLAAIDRDPDFRARARAALAEITGKLPSGMQGGLQPEETLADELDALCAEAEAVILGRLRGRAC
ncbi:DNA repair exonuclease SbcCD nuclease subunit [Methylobacterium sp. BE186]|uniref:metallophosphoesterase family protein n=1 Tax=Methylobacterium sp. BE186 TaxID=2817715 RepID=UPI002866A71D|nr:DNA repair exonuclease [Methylobacterium sp. BE186]MDR7040239.1 DNA repair exonuclease SbcCD nuclease subunit [Methylobacterium sp. BE186]